MEYLLFTFPNCPNCEKLKEVLAEESFEVEEFNLTVKEGIKKIREFLPVVKRDKKGGIIIPTLVIREENRAEVVNSPEEFQDWLKSRG
ncbi:MAG: hypothetical protein JXB26_12680 [Candidatus Aminicenantes bacterium]|nr:hypothetical protein [Candidatus Aminicenantes bacterium]